MVLLVYLLPCFWLSYLLVLLTQLGLAAFLTSFPVGLSTFVYDYALFVAIGGGVLVLVGNLILLWEMTHHKNFPRNMDFVVTLLGMALVVLAFLVQPQWPQAGVSLATFLLLPTAMCYALRFVVSFTKTALESLLFFSFLIALAGLGSWFLL